MMKKIICIVGLIIGVGILLYPGISQYLYNKNSSRAVASYDDTMDRLREEQRQALLDAAHEYNEEFYKTRKCLPNYNEVLNVSSSGMMGYILIPKIGERVPVYHGTAENTLQSGIGHYEDSSLPVGGESTHAVLTGHTGLQKAEMFSDLDRLEIGDMFFIKILGETFAYTVNQIMVVEPYEVSNLRIDDGKDYVTLITCTPYGVNTHRLLVRGERTEWNEDDDTIEQIVASASFWERLPIQYRQIIIGVAVVIFLVILFKVIYEIKNRKQEKKS